MKVAFAVLMMFGFGCSTISKKEALFDKVVSQVEICQKKKNNLDLIGSGGSIPENIEGFNLHFNVCKNVDVSQAREIAISVVEDLLSRVNSNREILQYLQPCPFTENQTDLIIAFYQPNGQRALPPNVASVYVINGKMLYTQYEEDNIKKIPPSGETYAEAVALIKRQKSI